MREFDLVIKHTSGKEILWADTASTTHKYSLDTLEEQDFIPQRIHPTEDNIQPHNTYITTNNLSISPLIQNIKIVSRVCIKFKNSNYDYNKCIGCDESLSHHLFYTYLDDKNDGDSKDYNDIKEE